MARAKNTTRAEARRRSRAMTRAEIEAAELEDDTEATADTDEPATERRPSGFKLPNFRQDLRDLPQILTSRRAMIIAPAVLLLAFVLGAAVSGGLVTAAFGLPFPDDDGFVSFAEVAAIYVQVFLFPPALLTYFLAGYLAPRGSYLVGALTGALAGLLWILLSAMAPPLPDGDGLIAADAIAVLTVSIAYGTFAAAFAAWYRDFLRRMRDQGMARRSDREAQERAKRRDKRQSDRQALKRGGR